MRGLRLIAVALTVVGFASACTAANLLINGDFEAIDAKKLPENWAAHSWSPQATVAATTRPGSPGGGRYFELSLGNPNSLYGCFSRAVDVSELRPKRVMLSFRYQTTCERAQAMVVGFKDDFMVKQWETRPLFDEARPMLAYRNWTTQTWQAEVLPGTKQLVVVFQLLSQGTLKLDNVVMRPVPDEIVCENLEIGRVVGLPTLRQVTCRVVNHSRKSFDMKVGVRPTINDKPQGLISQKLSLAAGEQQDVELRYNASVSDPHTAEVTVCDAATDEVVLYRKETVPGLIDAQVDVPAFRSTVMNTDLIREVKVSGRLFSTRDLAGTLRLQARLLGTGAQATVGNGMDREGNGDFSCRLSTEGLLIGEHQVQLEAYLRDRLVATTYLPLRRAKPADNEVLLDASHHLIVGGRQVFPIGIYHVLSPDDLPALREAGFNLITVPSARASYDMADRAAAAGIGLIVTSPTTRRDFWENRQAKFGPHPAFVGWETLQRPDAKTIHPDITLALYQILCEVSPNHPVLSTLCYTETMAEYARSADIIVPWELPVPELPLAHVGEVVAAAREATQDRKPIWALIQATGNSWATDKLLDPATDGRLPTTAEVRALAYLAIVHGADGLMYYSYSLEQSIKERNYNLRRDAPELWAGISALNKELGALGPIIASRDDRVDFAPPADPAIHAAAWRQGDKMVLIAVNSSDHAVVTTFTCPEARATELELAFEGRKLTTDRPGQFGDVFQPYQVHVYNLPSQ